jgi:hypothetical protein
MIRLNCTEGFEVLSQQIWSSFMFTLGDREHPAGLLYYRHPRETPQTE